MPCVSQHCLFALQSPPVQQSVASMQASCALWHVDGVVWQTPPTQARPLQQSVAFEHVCPNVVQPQVLSARQWFVPQHGVFGSQVEPADVHLHCPPLQAKPEQQSPGAWHSAKSVPHVPHVPLRHSVPGQHASPAVVHVEPGPMHDGTHEPP